MDTITEEALTKQLAGEQDTESTGILADLEAEFKEEEPKTEEAPVEEQPAQEEEPKEEQEEPSEPEKQEEESAEEPKEEEPEKEPKLILGKFKSQEDLINAYKNLEKKFGEKSHEVKEAIQVQSDDFDKAVDAKIAEETWKLVDKAFDTITDPEHAKEAQYMLSQFKKTGDSSYLEKARGYLDARVDRQLEVSSMNTASQIRMKANEHRQEILLKPLEEELDKMEQEDPDFMHDEQNQDLMAMAIRLNPTKIDVRAVKKAIQDYRSSAYQKGYEAAKKELAKQAEKKTVSVKSTTHIEQPKPKKPVEAMSIKEQLEEEMKSMI